MYISDHSTTLSIITHIYNSITVTDNKTNMSSSSASVSWIVGILVGIILGIFITVAVWVEVLVYDRKYKAKKPTMNIKTYVKRCCS